MSANMYANKKYNEEVEEIISILKGFDFCYMTDLNANTVEKYKKIASEIDERLVKVGKKKAIKAVEMVAKTRGGDVYLARCPAIFPMVYGNVEQIEIN